MAVSFILIKIISPERCSSLVFSINYKWQIVFIANQFVSLMKMFRKPVPVSASAFSIIKKCCGQTSKKTTEYSPPKMQNEILEWQHFSFIYPVVQLSLYAYHLTAKRQSCGWHFRYRHPDTTGMWLAGWHLVSCLKEEEG
ncbi:E3 ubiquitin-protein ligase synoviolin-A [Trichinella spiralis]|uniref:E3 ubiquitin-protein ligase synoviolin-A n=1 Tax=Trichinella spiralis TaxID=6334 RepID=UPI0001EFBBE5|nr:E3 ubiquitin-protein ligase synoviolin-A [Trichinella spiralis]